MKILGMSFTEKKKYLVKQGGLRLNPDKNAKVPMEFEIEKEMEEWLYSQKVWSQGVKFDTLERHLQGKKADQMRINSSLMALMKLVGFATFSNFSLELKLPIES